MPTAALYEANASHPDAWHHVRAPGGYEWWYFDAQDAEHDRQFVAIFFDGFVLHPKYLRQHARYLRSPTRQAPPLPEQFPCVYFVLYERGRIRRQFLTQYPPRTLSASESALHVQIGPNLLREKDGGISLSVSGVPWKIGARGPALLQNEALSADIQFIPRLPAAPHQQRFFSRKLSGADHFWTLANPLCDVRATINAEGEEIHFQGVGYHDHNFGSGPLGDGLKRWMWGRVLLDDRACVFHWAQPRDDAQYDEVHLLEIDRNGATDRGSSKPLSVERWSKALLKYPGELHLSSLSLRRPRLIDVSPFYLRLQYDAQWRGVGSQAFCEIAYPHRLRWPILGRMIEMSIHQPPALT